MALCVVCPDGTLCAGWYVCGDPPNCDDPNCQDQGQGGGDAPPPLNATFACEAINATPARYRLTLYGTARFLHQGSVTRIAGRQVGVWWYGEPLVVEFDGLLERVERYHDSHHAAYYAQNQYNEIGSAGRPLTFQDGIITEEAFALPLDNERQNFQR